ncbi:single-strand-selective monofunctional uracil-DNA glycosylase [Arctopsyche grandis]|uniref:single-strand-selective monofunctional uracil-DNA glycosylase n=1 Tax=Arctopsyche grandis TaxID=121162 RepID=UPI00406D9422
MSKLTRKRKSNQTENSEDVAPSNDSKKLFEESEVVVSAYFSQTPAESPSASDKISAQLLHVADILNSGLKDLKFSEPVKFIYNPTVYAFDPFKNYIEKFGNVEKKILFLGMNPGPFGMSQTGVPFGEINAVKSWLDIKGKVGKPDVECSSRLVLGFDCQRSEVSGKRFWDLAKTLCDTPETFFKNCFVFNYCPLQFIAINGKNVTPTDLKKQESDTLNRLCDTSLIETIRILNSKIVIGIGKFAEKQLKKVLVDNNTIEIYSIPHPSPRATNNTDWQNKTIKHMESLNLLQYFTK